MSDNVIHIVPDEAVLLDVRSKFPCTVDGCDRTLPNYGALRMHLVKTHKCYQNEEDRALGMKQKKVDTTKYLYHCPVVTCPKHQHHGQTNSYFTSMKLLKQHYGKQHAEKKYKCSKCERGFGLERDKRRHEETCGFLLTCKTCGCPYSTVEAMLTHCRRKDHEPPPECCSKKRSSDEKLKKPSPGSVEMVPPATPSIIVINVLAPHSESPGHPSQGAGSFRHILPKPLIQKTVPYTTVTMANNQVLVTQENLEPRQNADTQTDRRLREQGTSTSAERSVVLPCGRSARDAGTVISPGCRDASVSVHPGNRETGTSMADFCSLNYNNKFQQLVGCGTFSKSSINNFDINNGSPQQSNYNMPSDPLVQSSVGTLLGPCSDRPVFGISPADSACSTKGMQTLMSLPLRSQLSIAVAETQTPGDYILKQAMASAHIALNKESKGSQVSPRAKGRGHRHVVPVSSQSCQTSRLSEQHKSPRRKRQRKCASGDYAVSDTNKALLSRCDIVDINNRGSPASEDYLCGLSAGEAIGLSDPGLLTAPVRDTGVYSHRGKRGPGQTGVGRLHTSTSHHTTSMLIDGPQGEDIPGSLAGLDDLTDHQTQTMGILDQWNSPAASISTQTPDSYLAQPNEVGAEPEGANIQHSHTQTFVSAFTPLTEPLRPFEGATKNPVLGAPLPTDREETLPDAFQTSYGNSGLPSHSAGLGGAGIQSAITFTNSDVQTSATDLLNLLDMGVQADSGPGTTIQTQTDVDEMWELFCHNMETQTANDLLLQDLEFSDIQIQTNLDLECLEDSSSTVETQTMWHSGAAGSGSSVEQSDMQTQTRFPAAAFDPDLTDSHTQTPWEDITSLIMQDFQ